MSNSSQEQPTINANSSPEVATSISPSNSSSNIEIPECLKPLPQILSLKSIKSRTFDINREIQRLNTLMKSNSVRSEKISNLEEKIATKQTEYDALLKSKSNIEQTISEYLSKYENDCAARSEQKNSEEVRIQAETEKQISEYQTQAEQLKQQLAALEELIKASQSPPEPVEEEVKPEGITEKEWRKMLLVKRQKEKIRKQKEEMNKEALAKKHLPDKKEISERDKKLDLQRKIKAKEEQISSARSEMSKLIAELYSKLENEQKEAEKAKEAFLQQMEELKGSSADQRLKKMKCEIETNQNELSKLKSEPIVDTAVCASNLEIAKKLLEELSQKQKEIEAKAKNDQPNFNSNQKFAPYVPRDPPKKEMSKWEYVPQNQNQFKKYTPSEESSNKTTITISKAATKELKISVKHIDAPVKMPRRQEAKDELVFCPWCTLDCECYEGLIEHIFPNHIRLLDIAEKFAYNGDQKEIICSICSNKFENRSEFVTHMFTEHREAGNLFVKQCLKKEPK